MFSPKIISSARFLKMPIDTQLLYFHLGMNADDDGVVEAYTVIKSVGSNEDNLRVLSAKGFVKILNEDLVSFITDWSEHNLIRADRKVDSIYKPLLLQIIPEAELIDPKPRADTGQLTQAQQRSSTQYLPSNFKAKLLPMFDSTPCPVCNKIMSFNGGSNQTSVQHNIGISRGGEHRIENISVICLECNMKLKSKDTGDLNNAEVQKIWSELNGRQMDAKWTPNGRHKIGKDRIGEVKTSKENTDKEPVPETSKPKIEKQTFGEMEKVKLTSEEYQKLIDRIGEKNTQILIFELDTYIASKGARYQSHYATILNWAKRKAMDQLQKTKVEQTNKKRIV